MSDHDADRPRADRETPVATPAPRPADRDARRARRRLDRETRTVRLMLELYCRDHHGPGRVPCAACDELWRYVQERLAHCPFAADKPTCLRCNVHCFRPAMRERIREVMRYAGPRITWRHPVLALRHLLDGRRPPPARRPSGRG